MMNEERINQLQRYLETLVKLKDTGFHCNVEIQLTTSHLAKELDIIPEGGFNLVSGSNYKPVRASQMRIRPFEGGEVRVTPRDDQ